VEFLALCTDRICYRLGRTQGHTATGRIRSTKNLNSPTGNRSPGLPACGALPQPTAPSPTLHEVGSNTDKSSPRPSVGRSWYYPYTCRIPPNRIPHTQPDDCNILLAVILPVIWSSFVVSERDRAIAQFVARKLRNAEVRARFKTSPCGTSVVSRGCSSLNTRFFLSNVIPRNAPCSCQHPNPIYTTILGYGFIPNQCLVSKRLEVQLSLVKFHWIFFEGSQTFWT
jgi:hypothetical protein